MTLEQEILHFLGGLNLRREVEDWERQWEIGKDCEECCASFAGEALECIEIDSLLNLTNDLTLFAVL